MFRAPYEDGKDGKDGKDGEDGELAFVPACGAGSPVVVRTTGPSGS